MIRWGILSTAKVAVTHAIPALQAAEGCTVSAIASRSEYRARDVADKFGIRNVCGCYDALLDRDDIDAVYIPLPTSHHVGWTSRCAEAGKHVLCEKPIALTAPEIDGLIDARDKSGVIISEAMMAVYHPQWQKVRNLVADGAIGRLRHVTASFAYHNTDPGNIRNRIETGGGALPDIGCYPVATTLFASGADASRVVAQVHRDRNFRTDVNVAALVDFGEFDLLMHIATQIAWRQSAMFHGEKGFIELTAPFNTVPGIPDRLRLSRDSRQEPDIISFEGVNQYQLQFEAFGRAISAKDSADLVTLESSRKTQSIIDTIYRSAEDRAWQTIT